MGAWIEIREDLITAFRGWVAPLVGAWIEIKIVKIPQKWELVAPLVGAWIEMYELNFAFTKLLSLPLWERGLKFHLLLQLTRDI